MTDKEIIEALECCGDPYDICANCPIPNDIKDDCRCCEHLANNALDLINRQQAEIERLTAVKGHIDTLIHRGIEYPTAEAYEKAFQKALEHLYDNVNAKSEAIKEFAERLKNEIISDTAYGCDSNQHSGYYDYTIKIGDIPEYIDNLVKEMVGDKE